MGPPRWLVIVLAAWLGWMFRRPFHDDCNQFEFINKEDARELIAVVTGATGGLGLVTVERLAKLGVGKIYAAGRTIEKATETTKHLGPTIIPVAMDLADLKSVVQFAKEFSQSHSRLDILINNAAVVSPPYMETKNGFESQIGVSHLGHYVLTRLLIPKLVNSTFGGKIVHVSSRSANIGKIDPKLWKYSIPGAARYAGRPYYGHSKLAQVVFAKDLDRRFKNELDYQKALKMTSNAVHPGVVITDAQRHMIPREFNGIVSFFGALITSVGFMDSPKVGTNTQLVLAMSPAFSSVSGGFLTKCAPRTVPSAVIFDTAVMNLVWDASMFYVDPDMKLFSGREVLAVRPVEDWDAYVPPSEVTTFDEFDFSSQFDAWSLRLKDQHVIPRVEGANNDKMCDPDSIKTTMETSCQAALSQARDECVCQPSSGDSSSELGKLQEDFKSCKMKLEEVNATLSQCEEDFDQADEEFTSQLQQVSAEGESCRAELARAKSAHGKTDETCQIELSKLKEEVEKNGACQADLENIKAKLHQSADCDLELTKVKDECGKTSQDGGACQIELKRVKEESEKIDDTCQVELSSMKEQVESQGQDCAGKLERTKASVARCEEESKAKLDALETTFGSMVEECANRVQSLTLQWDQQRVDCERVKRQLVEEKDTIEKSTVEQLAVIKAEFVQCEQEERDLVLTLEETRKELSKAKWDARRQLQQLTEELDSERQRFDEAMEGRVNLEGDVDACEKRLKKALEALRKTKEIVDRCEREKSDIKSEAVETLKRQSEQVEIEARDGLDRAREKMAELKKMDESDSPLLVDVQVSKPDATINVQVQGQTKDDELASDGGGEILPEDQDYTTTSDNDLADASE